jgi:Tfp pilus assembly protein PilF
MLLESNEPAQALKEFEASMRVEPNRFRGFFGAARAAELAGDRTKARTYYSQLVTLGEKADSERPEIRQAKTFLGK